MPDIALIAEGVTDQQLLQRFIVALWEGEEININFLQPPSVNEPGNWDKVLKYCASERFRGAFPRNDFVVIHVDTDVSNDFHPPIPHQTNNGEDIHAEILIEKVCERLITEIDRNAPGYYNSRAEQIIFAIAVHSIECWLLPLYHTNNLRNKQVECLNALNQKLNSQEKFSIDPAQKGKGYALLMRTNTIKRLKRQRVLEISQYNLGFQRFVEQFETLINTSPITEGTLPESL